MCSLVNTLAVLLRPNIVPVRICTPCGLESSGSAARQLVVTVRPRRPPPPPRERHPDDGANGASATSATNSGNDSGRSGPVADGTTLVQVHTGMVGTTAAAANGSCEVDHKRKRNDTSGPANAMRAWLLPPPGGHPPGTKTAMEGAMAVRLGLTPPPPPVLSCWTQLGVLGRQWLKPSRPGSRDVRLTSWPLGREGASRKTTTKLGMWRVGEFCGTSAGEERLPVVVRARLARGRETRSAQHSRQGAVTVQ